MKNSEILSRFHEKYPSLVKFMRESDHNYSAEYLNPYHLEGDVWTHTMMVFNAASSIESDVVRIAALLHDVGKPHCKDIKRDTKRVRFFGHEGVSFFMAKDILRDCYPTLSDQDAKDCLYLIANHSILFPRNNDKLTVESALNMVNDRRLLKQLIELVMCDSSGRIVDPVLDDATFADTLYYEVYQNIDPASSVDGSASAGTNDQQVMTMLIGLPGSGKSYWSSHNTTSTPTAIISRDDTMVAMGDYPTDYQKTWETVNHKQVDQAVNAKFQNALKTGVDIVVDKTNLTRRGRRKYINPAKQKGYRIEAKIFVPGMDVDTERRRNRENNKVISDEVISSMCKSFSFPLDNEVDDWEIIF